MRRRRRVDSQGCSGCDALAVHAVLFNREEGSKPGLASAGRVSREGGEGREGSDEEEVPVEAAEPVGVSSSRERT